jgi:exonuclease VII large subunit
MIEAQNRKLDELVQDNKDLRDRIRNLPQALHAAQNRKIDELVQDNKDLRDRIQNLSQILHRKIDGLVQGNGQLRDGIRNLSQTVQSSKKDMQRVENISNNMASELKGKFEYMLEKSENRILGPINRLSEELERIRANPPAPPVAVPSSTAFPSTAPYPPEPPAGDGEWTSRDDYTPVESNKPHYEESWGNYRQPVRLTSQSSQAKILSPIGI